MAAAFATDGGKAAGADCRGPLSATAFRVVTQRAPAVLI